MCVEIAENYYQLISMKLSGLLPSIPFTIKPNLMIAQSQSITQHTDKISTVLVMKYEV